MKSKVLGSLKQLGGKRPTNEEYKERKLPAADNDDGRRRRAIAIARTLGGVDENGVCHTLKCKCKFNNKPCYDNIWDDAASDTVASIRLEAHLEWFMGLQQKERGDIVFQLLRNHLMVDESGKPVQNYVINGRRVCRFIFLLNFPISEATLKRVLGAIRDDKPAFYAAETDRESFGKVSRKRYDLIGWILAWAHAVGDQLPGEKDSGYLVVPKQDLVDIWREYEDDCITNNYTKEDILQYDTFRKIWHDDKALAHIRMGVDRRNFQKCDDCVAHRAAINRAKLSSSKEALRQAKHAFHEHLALQRGERAVYYHRRAEGEHTFPCLLPCLLALPAADVLHTF